MGLYACEKCFKEFKLTPETATGLFAPCEICGALNGDWEVKWCNFTWTINRVFNDEQPSIAEQIKEHMTRPNKVIAAVKKLA